MNPVIDYLAVTWKEKGNGRKWKGNARRVVVDDEGRRGTRERERGKRKPDYCHDLPDLAGIPEKNKGSCCECCGEVIDCGRCGNND